MLETLLLVSYINLLTLLPLFGGYRLAENMGEIGTPSTWEWALSSPAVLCGGVVLAATFIALRLAESTGLPGPARRGVLFNSLLMFSIWVLPDLSGAEPETKRAFIDWWTVSAGVVLLVSSLHIPFKALWKALIPPSKD